MKNGNTVTRGTQTGTGGEVVRTMSRRMSQPPFVSLFGGVAPTGAIAEEGLRASRAIRRKRNARRRGRRSGALALCLSKLQGPVAPTFFISETSSSAILGVSGAASDASANKKFRSLASCSRSGAHGPT